LVPPKSVEFTLVKRREQAPALPSLYVIRRFAKFLNPPINPNLSLPPKQKTKAEGKVKSLLLLFMLLDGIKAPIEALSQALD
jgi:hypothetical protein